MLDLDTFLTTLYVMADDFCKENLGEAPQSGRPAALAPSEVITLALVGQFWRFRSEQEFCRYARRHLQGAFPRLPDRAQFNREVRYSWKTLVAFGQGLVDHLQAQQVIIEVLDSVPVPVRNSKRRGRGWLGGLANIGWSTRLGWYNGFHGLIAVNSIGVITGFAFSNYLKTPIGVRFSRFHLKTSIGKRSQAQNMGNSRHTIEF